MLAVQFLTRLPVPPLARISAAQAQDGLIRSMAWLPIVGSLIGSMTAGVFVVAAMYWPPVIAILMALMVEALLTGAFHEDAVADFCDAFGGTATGDEARRIMKDSRIGSYGALGLGLSVALRAAAVVALWPGIAVAAIVGAATMGRLWAVMLATIVPPVAGGGGVAAGIGGVSRATALLAAATAIPGLLPIMLLRPAAMAVVAVVGVLFLLWLGRFLHRRIGGSTGDCLGFAAYMGQLALLLAVVVR